MGSHTTPTLNTATPASTTPEAAPTPTPNATTPAPSTREACPQTSILGSMVHGAEKVGGAVADTMNPTDTTSLAVAVLASGAGALVGGVGGLLSKVIGSPEDCSQPAAPLPVTPNGVQGKKSMTPSSGGSH